MNRSGKLLGLGCLAALLLAVAGGPLGAQSPQPPDPDPKANPQGDKRPLSDAERRKLFRDGMQRMHDQCEQALRALDEGKSLEEVRQMFPGLQRFGFRAEHSGPRQGGGGGPDDGDNMDRLGPNFPGGGAGGRSGERGGQPDHAMTPEERRDVREVLEATMSARMLKHFQELEKNNPSEADRRLTESFRRLRNLLELRKRDQKLYEHRVRDVKFGVEAAESAQAIAALDNKHSTDTAERARHEAALRSALTEQYNARTKAMQREAEGLKERGATMLADAEKRDAQLGPVVEKNMRTLIEREKKHLERHADKDRPGPAQGAANDPRPGDPPPPPPG